MRTRPLLITFFLLLPSLFKAQLVHLTINPVDVSSAFITDTLHLKTSFNSPILCVQYLKQLPDQLHKSGYISASIDSISYQKDTTNIFLFVGKKYIWGKIQVQEKDKLTLQQVGFKENSLHQKVVNPQQVSTLEDKLLAYHLANGYPFASIQLDSVQFKQNLIHARLSINNGVVYTLDSIRVLGTTKISKQFLYHYLGFLPGSLFNITQLNNINQLLLQLPYLEQSQPWELVMLSNSYLLNLYLKPKKSNQLNVIAGFLPANTQTGNQLLFTGEANINLKNAFASGETIGINWQQLQASSPRLNIIYQKPYLFNSLYGIDFAFDLFKKDSSYLNITSSIGIQYLATPKQVGKVSLQTFSTHLISVDTASIILSKKLPSLADVKHVSLVIDYVVDGTNYKPNPLHGHEYSVTIGAGSKQIKKNNTVLNLKDTGFNYKKLYDTIQLNSYQVTVKGMLAKYFGLGKQSVLKSSFTGGLMYSASYFRNEIFQLGGYKLLRGFNEESILGDKFGVITLEYRYLLGQNSYFNAFTDIGYVYNSINVSSNTYLGSGLGLAFQAKQGIINVSLAAGKSNNLPFNLKETKIHIGFVSIF